MFFFMLGSAPRAEDVVIPTANVSNLNKTPVTTVAGGGLALDAMRHKFLSPAAAETVKAGAVGKSAEAETVEAAAVGKDFPYILCYAYTRMRIYAYSM